MHRSSCASLPCQRPINALRHWSNIREASHLRWSAQVCRQPRYRQLVRIVDLLVSKDLPVGWALTRDLALISCQLFSAILLGASRLPEPRVCTQCGSVAVADELHMIFECPALQAVRQQYAPLFSTDTNTMRFFFAQQDHMQVFKFVLHCLGVFKF